MSIIRLGKLIDTQEFEKYIFEAEKLDTVIHKYGTEFVIPNYPCWMEYKNEGNVEGSIAFGRNTINHPILREMAHKVAQLLTPIFPAKHPPMPEGIHLVRTIGSIVKHRDEANRNACINIGLKNSSVAVTKISTDGIYENFEINNTSHRVEDGVAYLLNTNQIHSVEAPLNIPRYLITYGFREKFNSLTKILNINSLQDAENSNKI